MKGLLGGAGFVFALFAVYIMIRAGIDEKIIAMITPQKQGVEERLTDAKKRKAKIIKTGVANLSLIDDLALLISVEGGQQKKDYFLIALAAKNYLALHKGSSYRSLWGTADLVFADQKIHPHKHARKKSSILSDVGGEKSEQYGDAMMAAEKVLKGEYPARYDPREMPWLSCISRIHRAKSVGYYFFGGFSRRRARSKLREQFGNPVYIGQGGTEFFCHK